MRFLIVTKPKFPVPAEMAGALNDAMTIWFAENSASGAIAEGWGFAGLGGGGGIANVKSLEELDALMTSFPYGQMSEVEIYGLTDLGRAWSASKRSLRPWLAARGRGQRERDAPGPSNNSDAQASDIPPLFGRSTAEGRTIHFSWGWNRIPQSKGRKQCTAV
jgi:hypothetical protein